MKHALSPLIAALALLPIARRAQPGYAIDVFATVPAPGQPEGIAMASDGTIFTGSAKAVSSTTTEPSAIFAYDAEGNLVQQFTVQGQDTSQRYGVLGMAVDASDLLYVADLSPPRIFRLDPHNGAQTDYALLPDLPPCIGAPDGACSATVFDQGAFPNFPVFGPDGSLYVSDTSQALIWRIPRGGGSAEVWFTDASLEAVFGPNGIQFMADGATLLFALTGSQPPGSHDPGTGKLFTLPVLPDGSPGALSLFWEGDPADGPDGFAIGASGAVYVTLAGKNQIAVIDASGSEITRVPATPAENALLEIPVDAPASAIFLEDRLLFTNQSLFAGNPASWAILELATDDTGLPLFAPQVVPSTPALGRSGFFFAVAAIVAMFFARTRRAQARPISR